MDIQEGMRPKSPEFYAEMLGFKSIKIKMSRDKYHLDAFYTSHLLSKLIEQAKLQKKLGQQSTISIDDEDESLNKKIQPNSLIEYMLTVMLQCLCQCI
nr:3083_t:CDS:2 [Entrophospora candida]